MDRNDHPPEIQNLLNRYRELRTMRTVLDGKMRRDLRRETEELFYSCAYQYNLSWRIPTQPMAPETNPRALFERLFGLTDKSADAIANRLSESERKSLLDYGVGRCQRFAARVAEQ